MPTFRRGVAGLVPVGFQKETLDHTSVAVGLDSTTRTGATVVDVSVETNAVRYRADGTAPTQTTGVVLPKDLAPFRFWGFNGTSQLEFINSGDTTAIVSAQSYKYEGDE